MFETISESEMKEKARLVIDHLKAESNYLDSVIESSLEMQSLLRERKLFQPASVEPANTESKPANPSPLNQIPHRAHTAPVERKPETTERLNQIREQLARESLPVMQGRKKMVETMNSIDPNQKQTPSVTALTLKVDEPFRSKLKELRKEIRAKLNQVQTIAMGNQAILLYTMDFYNRLLTGLSPDQQASKYYNSTGKTQNHFSVNLIETNC